MKWLLLAALSAPLALSCVVAGCSSENLPTSKRDAGTTKKDTGADEEEEEDNPIPVLDSGVTPVKDAGPKSGRVYAHTAKVLYLFEPYSNDMKKIGNFGCLTAQEEMFDLAVDQSGGLFGTVYDRDTANTTSDWSFVEINLITAACTKIAQGSEAYPNSLTFLPSGTLDPSREALVGYNGNSYMRIDTTTGKPTVIGTLNTPDAGETYSPAGDLVSIIGDKTYITLKNAAATKHFLGEVDPKTGRLIKLIGETNTPDLFGVGYWGGVVYGFKADGAYFSIDSKTGAATKVGQLTGSDAGGGTQGIGFYGAGSSTAAPINR
jgi:hypothetical protein